MNAVSRWLLPEWPAERLAVIRIALGGYVLQDLIRVRDAMHVQGRIDPRLFDPVGVATLLDGPLDPAAWSLVYDGTIVAAILFILGIGWRVTGPLFGLVLLFTWTYRVSWQMIYHVHHLTMLHVLVVAAAPAGAALSVDAWLKRRRGAPPAAASWRYGWPVRLICVVTALCYLMAGIAKVDKAGWAWADGHNLLDQMAYDGLYKGLLGRPKDWVSPYIAMAYENLWIVPPLATTALALEIGAPLALAHRRLGYLWSIGAYAMHWGINMFMSILFPYPVSGIAFFSFFPVEKLVPRRWRAPEAAAQPPAPEAQAAEIQASGG